jgi:cobalt-zinc-cadmium efflux system protein
MKTDSRTSDQAWIGCPPPEQDAPFHNHAHEHDQGHDHGAQGHDHAPKTDTKDSRRRVLWAALLTSGFMLVEVIGATISGSLALLADAAHMLTDAGSLALAFVGYKLSERPADSRRSYGFGRIKILAAFTNGILLIALGFWIIWEAIQRLMNPGDVLGGLLLIVAGAGLIVNLLAFFLLHGGDRLDLNLSGAIGHVLGDLLGSAAAIVAALVILATGWMAIDPILSIVVALIVLRAGWQVTRRSGHILLEGTPEGLDLDAVHADLTANINGLKSASHLHAWTLSEKDPLITLEAEIAANVAPEHARRAIKERLAQKFGIRHATVEIIQSNEQSITRTD